MIHLQLRGFSQFLSRKRVDALFRLAVQAASYHHEITIDAALVNSATSQRFNKRYRGIDASTDVLSFRYSPSSASPDSPLVGEILIARDIARRQAKELGHSLVTELEFLLLHGFLHVLGYDHEKKKDAEIMFGLQDKVIIQFHRHD